MPVAKFNGFFFEFKSYLYFLMLRYYLITIMTALNLHIHIYYKMKCSLYAIKWINEVTFTILFANLYHLINYACDMHFARIKKKKNEID